MFQSAQDVVNYYLQNPPFEIDENNQENYISILEKSLNQTLLEISENDPIYDEKIFTTPDRTEENKNITDDNLILVDIYETIDERFMDFVVLTELSELPMYINRVLGRYIPIGFYNMRYTSLLNLLDDDALFILHEYTWKRIERFLIKDRYIKLKPNTEYYTLYKRYRTIDEIYPRHMDCFLRLFEVNLFTSFYQSSTYTGDNLFRSFSISGLSISLNPPSVSQALRMLKEEKLKTLQECANYGDLVQRF